MKKRGVGIRQHKGRDKELTTRRPEQTEQHEREREYHKHHHAGLRPDCGAISSLLCLQRVPYCTVTASILVKRLNGFLLRDLAEEPDRITVTQRNLEYAMTPQMRFAPL